MSVSQKGALAGGIPQWMTEINRHWHTPDHTDDDQASTQNIGLEETMRFQTVHDLIDHSTQLHLALSNKYAELEMLVSSERAQWLLEYLNRHEANMAEALQKYDDDLKKGIKETWMQFTPDWKNRDLVGELETMNLNDLNDIIQVALQVDAVLVESLRTARDTAETEELMDLIQGLLDLEDAEQHVIARSMVRGLNG